MRKCCFFFICKTKAQISCALTAQLSSVFVLATQIKQPLYFLNPIFQGSSHHLLWLYSQVCVLLGRKPRKPCDAAQMSENNDRLTRQFRNDLNGNDV